MAQWLRQNRIELKDLQPRPSRRTASIPTRCCRGMQAFGYTTETMQFMLLPLVQQKRDPVGSMGNDSALACLSDQPRMLYDYFKQLFAQVTNPPIDSIREEVIMSLECYIGPERNLLETTEQHCHRLLVPHPILTNEELAALKEMDHRGWKTRTIDITFPRERRAGRDAGGASTGFAPRPKRRSTRATAWSCSRIGPCRPDRVPVSSLLACGAVHHHLVRQAKRTRIGIVLETGEAREVHHHCLLVGYGADAINPYLAFEALWQARRDGLLDAAEFPDDDKLVTTYREGVAKGMLKVMAKMGISTLQSYKGAQIFEAVGLSREVIDLCFAGTASRIQGVSLRRWPRKRCGGTRWAIRPRPKTGCPCLPNPGEFHWRAEGERHSWNPEAIADLQVAARTGRPRRLLAVCQSAEPGRPRPLHAARPAAVQAGHQRPPIPLEEVEPASEIVKRFCTGAMSFGSISAEAHESAGRSP